jgi:hypothetical protein
MNIELRETLISMSKAESKAWLDLTKNGNRYNGVPETFDKLRIKNAEALNLIIENHGWPGVSLVGEDGEIAAFKIARNAINKPELMKEFLKTIKEAVLKGEAKKFHEACLEDCILFFQNKPQHYGMFFDWDETGKLAVNVKNKDLANTNRKKLGLETIEEEMSNHEKLLLKEQDGKPKDIQAHIRQTHEWASKVGWINT